MILLYLESKRVRFVYAKNMDKYDILCKKIHDNNFRMHNVKQFKYLGGHWVI